MLQMPQESGFGVNEGIRKHLGSFKLRGMNPPPRLGLGTLLPFRLTRGPGPGGRVCRSPREPWVWWGARVGIDLEEEPLGRPGADRRILRGPSLWPARGGGGRRTACEHRSTYLKEGTAGGRAEW